MEKFSDQRTRKLYKTGEQENFFIGPKYEPEYIKTIVLWSCGLKSPPVLLSYIVLWSENSSLVPDYTRNPFRILREIAMVFPAVMARIIAVPVRTVGTHDAPRAPRASICSCHIDDAASIPATASSRTNRLTVATIV